MANSILSGTGRFSWLVACGSCSLTECVSSGAVTMKITSSTSITSISGTMLISDTGAPEDCRSKLAKAISVLPVPRDQAAAGRSGRTAPASAPRSRPLSASVEPVDRKVSSSKAKASSLALSTRLPRLKAL